MQCIWRGDKYASGMIHRRLPDSHDPARDSGRTKACATCEEPRTATPLTCGEPRHVALTASPLSASQRTRLPRVRSCARARACHNGRTKAIRSDVRVLLESELELLAAAQWHNFHTQAAYVHYIRYRTICSYPQLVTSKDYFDPLVSCTSRCLPAFFPRQSSYSDISPQRLPSSSY